MNKLLIFCLLVIVVAVNFSRAQNDDDAFKHGVYYQFQNVKHYGFIDSRAKNDKISHDSISVDSISSVKRGTIALDGSRREGKLDVRIDSSASSSSEVSVQVDDFVNIQKRIDNLERRQKKNAALSIDAGIYLEKAASDEKTSIVIACIGGVISGLIAGLTIPYGDETALRGTIASSVIGGTSAIVSFSFHCIAIKNVRRAGSMLSGQQR